MIKPNDSFYTTDTFNPTPPYPLYLEIYHLIRLGRSAGVSHHIADFVPIGRGRVPLIHLDVVADSYELGLTLATTWEPEAEETRPYNGGEMKK